MRFLVALTTLGLAVLVSAASSATSSDSSAASSTTASLSPQASCLQKCGTSDICCQAACVNVPCPSPSQVNDTTACAARCPQGNGTQADTQSYASCQSSCISSIFLATSGAPAATTGGNTAATNTATTTGSGSQSTGASGSGSAASTAAGSAASTSATGAANDIRLGAAGAGILGLFIAGLAL